MKKIQRKYNVGGILQAFSSPQIVEGMGVITSQFAKGGRVKLVGKDEGNYYYRRFNDAIGGFGWKIDNRYNEAILFPLDSFDIDYYSNIPLKDGEVLFRYETDSIKGIMKPIIKINIDKALVYFNDSDASEKDEVKFETRGVKADYIVLEEGYDKKFAKGGQVASIGDSGIITDKKSMFVGKLGLIMGELDNMYEVRVGERTILVKKNGIKIIQDQDEFAKGGEIGFIPIQLEEKIALLSHWGGTNARGVIGLLNAMIDSGITDEDLKYTLTQKETTLRRERAIEKKIDEIWNRIQPKYNQELKGNMYYSTLKELISRNGIYENLLKDFKPFRKYQNFAKGGKVSNQSSIEFVFDYVDEKYINKAYEILESQGIKVDARKKWHTKGYADELEDENSLVVRFDINDAKDPKLLRTNLQNLEKLNDGIDVVFGKMYAKGGQSKFEKLSKKVAKSYVGDKVKPKYQSQYGERYSKEEAKEVGDKVAAKVYRLQLAKKKMANGGEVEFIEYKDHQIMYEPNMSKYYANDVEFDTLEDAQNFLDSGKMSSDLRGAYERGLFAKGGLAKVEIVNEGEVFDDKKYAGILGDYDFDGLPNVDDDDPLDKGNKSQVEQLQFSKTFKQLLDTKNDLDIDMDKFVSKLRQNAPKESKIYARTKTPFSILNKLVSNRLLHEKHGLKDLVGTTIAFENLNDLNKFKNQVLAGKYGKVADFDDYYESPKDGYRAYHFIVEQAGVPIELQLKTERMKLINVLSHDAYKQKKLNSEYMDFLTNLAKDADEGNKFATHEFDKIMSDKTKVQKMLTI